MGPGVRQDDSEYAGISAIEQLPQHVVHRRVVAPLGGVGRRRIGRRWRGGLWCVRGGLGEAAARACGVALIEGGEALLQQVPDGVAELPAERIALAGAARSLRSEEHTSELQSPDHLVCRLLLEKK